MEGIFGCLRSGAESPERSGKQKLSPRPSSLPRMPLSATRHRWTHTHSEANHPPNMHTHTLSLSALRTLRTPLSACAPTPHTPSPTYRCCEQHMPPGSARPQTCYNGPNSPCSSHSLHSLQSLQSHPSRPSHPSLCPPYRPPRHHHTAGPVPPKRDERGEVRTIVHEAGKAFCCVCSPPPRALPSPTPTPLCPPRRDTCTVLFRPLHAPCRQSHAMLEP